MRKDQIKAPLKTLSDQALQLEVVRRRTHYYAYVVIILCMLAVAVYNATHKGAFIFSVMPLIFTPIFISIMKNYKDARAEQESRKR